MSANFTFGHNINVLSNPSREDQEFVDGIKLSFEAIGRLIIEFPFYKLYNNKLSQDFVKGQKVRSYIDAITYRPSFTIRK